MNEIQYHPVHSAKSETEAPVPPPPPLRFRYLPGRIADERKGEFNLEEAAQRMTEATADDVAAMHVSRGGNRQWNEIAVLVRKHRQAAAVQAALRRRGIRSVLHTEESVFHSGEAAELQRLLEGVLAPSDLNRLHTALVTPMLGRNGNTIASLTTESHQQWMEHFLAWRSLWQEGCFAAMFRRILVERDVRRQLMEWPGGERRLTNLLHLAELLHEAETTRRLTPEALIEWLEEQRAAERPSSDSAQLRMESEGDAVTLVTIHKSKGLEYGAVFCPFLWLPADSPKRPHVQFHDADGRLTMDLRGKSGTDEDSRRRHQKEALAEEVRLLYVAMTRAKHECVVYAGDIRGASESALGHLLASGAAGSSMDEIERLAAELPGSVACSSIEVPEDPGAPAAMVAGGTELPPDGGAPLAAREFSGALAYPAFLTSFSALTSGGLSEESAVSVESANASHNASTEPGAEPTLREAIFRFERGTRAGDFFHDVLEQVDFCNPGDLDHTVPVKLASHGFARNLWAKPIIAKLNEVFAVELKPGLRLNRIAKGDRLSEVEFSCRLNSLRPEKLRAIFSEYATPALDPVELGRLRFSPVEGFLRGFIDLLFHHEGRYYLVDWKSNWLGDTPEAYDSAGVAGCMRQHQYALQAHLYVLAVDRFLAHRLPDYEYERHFGGVFYLFLRGVERDNPERAIFRDRPALALVQKLRKLIG